MSTGASRHSTKSCQIDTSLLISQRENLKIRERWAHRALCCPDVRQKLSREDKNGVLAKQGLSPLPKTGGFDENGENDEWTLYPQKQGLCSSDPRKRRKWRKWRVSRTQRSCLLKTLFLHPRLSESALCCHWPRSNEFRSWCKLDFAGVLVHGFPSKLLWSSGLDSSLTSVIRLGLLLNTRSDPMDESFFQKNPRVRKIRVRNSGAGKGCANFMDAWKNCVLSAGKPPCP